MAINTPLYRSAQRALGGDLPDWLSERRRAGATWRSYDAIAAEFVAATGIEIAPQTWRTWGKALGADEAIEQAAS